MYVPRNGWLQSKLDNLRIGEINGNSPTPVRNDKLVDLRLRPDDRPMIVARLPMYYHFQYPIAMYPAECSLFVSFTTATVAAVVLIADTRVDR